MNQERAELFGRLQAFVVSLADYYDQPGPTPEKTAAHYQLAERGRQLRAEILLSQQATLGANHGS